MRRLALLATVMMLVMGGAIPAYAGHGDGIDGVWQARDPYDGSSRVGGHPVTARLLTCSTVDGSHHQRSLPRR